MIDTITLCGNTNEDWFAKLFGKSDQPSGPKDKFLADQQLAWIEDQLKNSKADYLFVAGHFPVYSVAEHGSTQCLIDKVLPLLETYKATAYLSGHDHSLQVKNLIYVIHVIKSNLGNPINPCKLCNPNNTSGPVSQVPQVPQVIRLN